MQKENSVIKNYILSPQKFILEDKLNATNKSSAYKPNKYYKCTTIIYNSKFFIKKYYKFIYS